jgi:hypothetical protein
MAETVTTIQQPAPIFEEGAKSYLDLLTAQTEAAGALKPLGDTPTTRAEGFAPGVEAQGALAQAAQQQAATQAGLGTLSFDPATGALSGVGTGTGIAGYQPFLDQAGTQAGLGQASLQTGLGNVQAGLSDIGTASTTLGGVPSYITGAAGYSGPNAYTSFQSPYQTAVRDATLSAFDDQAQARKQGISDQAVKLGAFGGGRSISWITIWFSFTTSRTRNTKRSYWSSTSRYWWTTIRCISNTTTISSITTKPGRATSRTACRYSRTRFTIQTSSRRRSKTSRTNETDGTFTKSR